MRANTRTSHLQYYIAVKNKGGREKDTAYGIQKQDRDCSRDT